MNRLQARKKFYPNPLNPQDITSETLLNTSLKNLDRPKYYTTKQDKATQYTQHAHHYIPKQPTTIYPNAWSQYTQTEHGTRAVSIQPS